MTDVLPNTNPELTTPNRRSRRAALTHLAVGALAAAAGSRILSDDRADAVAQNLTYDTTADSVLHTAGGMTQLQANQPAKPTLSIRNHSDAASTAGRAAIHAFMGSPAAVGPTFTYAPTAIIGQTNVAATHGVTGIASSGLGVWGRSSSGNGVKGSSSGSNVAGIRGEAEGEDGWGVEAVNQSGGVGLRVVGNTVLLGQTEMFGAYSDGLLKMSPGSSRGVSVSVGSGTAFYGIASSGTVLRASATSGVAVDSDSNTGTAIRGSASGTNGTGVRAVATGNATALSVSGPSSFDDDLTVDGIIAATTFDGSGSMLTALPAAQLTGLINDARLSTNIPRKDANTTVFTGEIKANKFAGDGGGLTSLPASQLTGLAHDDRLSTNIPRKDAASTTFAGDLKAKSFAGSGSGLTALNASAISSGKLADTRLGANVARRNAAQTTFRGTVRAKSFGGPGKSAPVFTTTGFATVPAGADRVRVTNAAASTATKILALLQANPGSPVGITRVEKRKGGFDIVLNGAVARATEVAFFIFR